MNNKKKQKQKKLGECLRKPTS